MTVIRCDLIEQVIRDDVIISNALKVWDQYRI